MHTQMIKMCVLFYVTHVFLPSLFKCVFIAKQNFAK